MGMVEFEKENDVNNNTTVKERKKERKMVVEKDFMTVSGNVGNYNCPYLPNVFLNLSNY